MVKWNLTLRAITRKQEWPGAVRISAGAIKDSLTKLFI